jgi:hypothetical protein
MHVSGAAATAAAAHCGRWMHMGGSCTSSSEQLQRTVVSTSLCLMQAASIAGRQAHAQHLTHSSSSSLEDML